MGEAQDERSNTGQRPQADGPLLGPSAAEAAHLLAQDGPNVLPTPPGPSALRRLVAQLTSVFAAVLWAAAALAWIAGMPELTVAVSVVIVLNAVFAFIQEARAGRAAARLRQLLPNQVIARRDGREVRLAAQDVVPGDLLCLRAGDRVPADCVVVGQTRLLVDMSLLTGESDAVARDAGDDVAAGSFVVEGSSDALVVATGARTRLAQIAHLVLDSPEPVTPLARELHRTVRTIALGALAAGSCFALVAVAVGLEPADAYILGIGVVVALVPEGLLPTVTLSLAWGAERMADRHILVRHLEAVETLGSVTVICTDKTGTITQNEMTAVEVWTPSGTASCSSAGYGPDGAVTCSDGSRGAVVAALDAATATGRGFAVLRDGRWSAHGDRIDVALDVLARRLDIDVEQERTARLDAVHYPFDARRRRTSAYVAGRVYVKGAPESLLPLCVDSPAILEAAHATAEDYARRGLRVIVVASRPSAEPPAGPDEAEVNLTLDGVLALQDPPRDDAAAALAACRAAGIRVAMLTGDHPETARSIADQVGLRSAADPIILGSDLPPGDDALASLFARSGVVVARVTPEDKLRVARALRARGEVVAMTGDGVNDAPALHEADIGIAMGITGTDVARDSADVVLLDDRFASIVAGIEQGRSTYANLRRFITYHLTDNVAELMPFVLWALSGGQFPLALGILQVLAIDIATDTLSAVALGAEPPSRHLLSDPPASGRLLDRTVARRAFGLLGPVSALAALTTFTLCLLAQGWTFAQPVEPDVLATSSGAAFMSIVFSQAANAFACRSSSRWPGALGWTSNRLLLIALPLSLALSFSLVLVPVLARTLGHQPPPLVGWLLAVASAFVLLAADAADKAWRERRRDRLRLTPPAGS